MSFSILKQSSNEDKCIHAYDRFPCLEYQLNEHLHQKNFINTTTKTDVTSDFLVQYNNLIARDLQSYFIIWPQRGIDILGLKLIRTTRPSMMVMLSTEDSMHEIAYVHNFINRPETKH